jgi:hypothetical protein
MQAVDGQHSLLPSPPVLLIGAKSSEEDHIVHDGRSRPSWSTGQYASPPRARSICYARLRPGSPWFPSPHLGGSARGYLPTNSRSWPLGRPLVIVQRERPTVFLCIGARGVNVRICHMAVIGTMGQHRAATVAAWNVSLVVRPGRRACAGAGCAHARSRRAVRRARSHAVRRRASRGG